MSTSSAINPKGPRRLPAERDPAAWATTYLTSTVGAKVVVAVTGSLLVGFVVFHMIGNLKVLFGRDEINAYAHFLKHSLGPYLWIARAGLLAIFVTHIGLTLWLKSKSAAARPVGYLNQRSAQASLQSQTMLLTGLLVGTFTLFHLAHYTFGWTNEVRLPDGSRASYLSLLDDKGRHDVYTMVVAGFTDPLLSVLYIAAQFVLFAHLTHGIQSAIQTLGLKGTRFAPVWVLVGHATAGLVLAGNLAIVLAVWTGAVAAPYPLAK